MENQKWKMEGLEDHFLCIFSRTQAKFFMQKLSPPHASKKIAFFPYLLNLPYGIHLNPRGHYVTLTIKQVMNGNLHVSF